MRLRYTREQAAHLIRERGGRAPRGARATADHRASAGDGPGPRAL